jgi:hypothetical protein
MRLPNYVDDARPMRTDRHLVRAADLSDVRSQIVALRCPDLPALDVQRALSDERRRRIFAATFRRAGTLRGR